MDSLLGVGPMPGAGSNVGGTMDAVLTFVQEATV